MRKKIYFVRHGESTANITATHSSHTTPLTERGHAQAEFIAERATKLPFDVLIASTMTRAQETARHIADKTGRPIENSDLFVEGRSASELVGKSEEDEGIVDLQKIIDENFWAGRPAHSDEEGFEDAKARVFKALEYLANRPEENILVVTHGWFLSMLVGVAIQGKDFSPEAVRKFVRYTQMENTGITILGYDDKNPSPWWLWVWNDHTHLG